MAGAFGGARLASSEASPTTVSVAPASAAASVASSPEAASSVGLPPSPGSVVTVVMFGDASALGRFATPSPPHPEDPTAAHATAAAVSHRFDIRLRGIWQFPLPYAQARCIPGWL